ncbi:hypothetical protein [Atribacter laminatus]|uniref:Uncharacterized protein n=1 Tax=Atribacter laminatus TaxID=2847778 RepID=A0A7T1F367_ATRLM|nr:hypothetical protein [Atribacter laminatus]QPM68080.1 hypothetical protein RT761_01294 [Atribacter laminatus]
MVDPAEKIGSILGEIERTKGIVKSPDRRSAYLTPLYTQLAQEIINEVKKQVKEDIMKELRDEIRGTSFLE